jgi:glycolate oxidase iron-sulfur subunit
MLIDEVKECSKCGKCRSVCPIFLRLKDEVMSPRGRISLIEAMLRGGLTDSSKYLDTVRFCLRCSRCSGVCPSGIEAEGIVQSARELLAEKTGIPDAAKEVFRSLLFDPKGFRDALVKAAESGQNVLNPPLWQLPLFFHENARIPEPAPETVLDKYPEYIDSGGYKRVALFLGCSINYVNTDIADSAIETFKRFGIDVFLPKDQVCCGTPALLYGDVEGVRELAERNVKALKAHEVDAVITLCPVGGVTLKKEYGRILGGDTEGFTSKVYDISEFIHRFVDYNSGQLDISITYHDPCYLRLGQGVENEPRYMLDKIARLVEMKDADKCCGLGGALGLLHPELSEEMADAKVESIVESGADVVATGCPGGILFLRDQLAKKGLDKKVLHTIQVVQKSMEA